MYKGVVIVDQKYSFFSTRGKPLVLLHTGAKPRKPPFCSTQPLEIHLFQSVQRSKEPKFCSLFSKEMGLSEAKTKHPSSRSRGRGAYGGLPPFYCFVIIYVLL